MVSNFEVFFTFAQAKEGMAGKIICRVDGESEKAIADAITREFRETGFYHADVEGLGTVVINLDQLRHFVVRPRKK
jgi:hypothetical protein